MYLDLKWEIIEDLKIYKNPYILVLLLKDFELIDVNDLNLTFFKTMSINNLFP